MTPKSYPRFIRALVLSILLGLASGQLLFAQLSKLEDPHMFSEVDIYVDNDGIEYATVINLKFAEAVLNPGAVLTTLGLRDVPLHYETLVSTLKALQGKYGDFVFEKRFPWAVPGGNPLRHRRTGEIVHASDYSQVFILRFAQPVPIDEVTAALSGIEVIADAEGPQRGKLLDAPFTSFAFGRTPVMTLVSPNDWAYVNGFQWYLTQVNSEQAWNISKGLNVKIGIVDSWDSSINQVHTDLNGRLSKHSGNAYGGHGTKVSGMAGAITNNGSQHASLGWEVDLEGYNWTWGGIVEAMMDGVDVINCSWVAGQSIFLEDAVYDALNVGIVVVAGAGNGPNNVPPGSVQYPAAYNFPSARHLDLNAQVIAVAASDENDRYLDTCPGGVPDQCPYNYSPGADPIGDPTNAFIDVAAPGISVKVLYSYYDENNDITHKDITNSGTSFSTPMVSALAALILATDNTLTPQQLYEVIIRAIDKVGQHAYPYTGLLGESWNQYFGYGRIDAYHALLVATQNPLPLIVGPSTLGVWEYGMWTADPQYGITPFQYDWYYRYCGETPYGPTQGPDPDCEPWVYAGSGTTLTRRDLVDFELKVVVTDAKGKTGEATMNVLVGGSAPSKQATAEVPPRISEALPTTYALAQNHPNPFNPTMEIRFQLPEAVAASLVVYDVTGREVRRLVEGVLPAGVHRVRFDAAVLPSGVYLYRLTAGAFTETRRMVLLK